MAGVDPAIQQHIEDTVFFMDGRIKCGNDKWEAAVFYSQSRKARGCSQPGAWSKSERFLVAALCTIRRFEMTPVQCLR
jgi:hypothetical protein